jgi:hypothetical protein
MNTSITKEKLDFMLNKGLLSDIYLARQSHALLITIGHKGTRLEGKGYTRFFSNLQGILADHLIIHITKIFEKPNDRYPNFSLPSILKHIETHQETLAVIEKGLVQQNLRQLTPTPDLYSLSSKEITRLILDHFTKTLPTVENSVALNHLKVLRDKRVVHREATDISQVPTGKLNEAIALVTYAEDFMCVAGPAYTSTFHGTAGEDFLVGNDSRMTQNSLEQLLEMITSANDKGVAG